MVATTEKQKALQAVRALPAEATLEDAIDRLCFLYKVEKGLGQADRGETVPHAEVRQRLRRWLKQD